MPLRGVVTGVVGAAACLAVAAAHLANAAALHQTPMAGRWFPEDAARLDALVARAWRSADERAGVTLSRPGLAALIVPHAGLEYSGIAAASAYRLVDRTPRAAIVLAFSHRAPLEGVAAVDVEGYTLPSGGAPVKVARQAVRELGFPVVEEGRLCDHSLENQLPFLRKALPHTPIVPLYVGRLDAPALASAARKLAMRLRAGDLIIASSDFTHYGKAYGYTPFPADARLRERLRERAEEAFEAIGSLSVEAFDRHLSATGDTICGRDPIRLLMAALAEAGSARDRFYMTTADYMTSADSAAQAAASQSDGPISVGYGALAFYPASSFHVDRPAQQTLLGKARSALEAFVAGRRTASPEATANAAVAQRTGAFVTIRRGGELRGCVGALAPRTGLLATIVDRTLAAARSDPRFPPLTRAEFPVTLEVSLLTPLKRLTRWQAWRPGMGAVITMDDAGGLLLPQVAAEMRWSRADQFLEGLARKAGLAREAYKDPRAKLYVFEAQVFGE